MNKRTLWLPFLALLLAGLAVGAWAWRSHAPPAERPAARMDDWDVTRLVQRLRARGLNLHVRSTARDVPTGAVFLTETERSWEELSRLRSAEEHLGEWRGVVFCERTNPGEAYEVRIRCWGGGCTVVEPFAFFGDPELRSRIEEALQDDEP